MQEALRESGLLWEGGDRNSRLVEAVDKGSADLVPSPDR